MKKENEISFIKEISTSYEEYAHSVLKRSIPDLKDGLKPVQRRILYCMLESGYTHKKPFVKSARVVGNTMANYHPHGDMAIYNALARMAQPFSINIPLIEGQGNFGSIEGDNPAAQRYTEVRLSKFFEYICDDLYSNTIDFVENYDNSLKEPIVLPLKLPLGLCNGGIGIAVAFSTNTPQHNLIDIIDTVIYRIDNIDCDIEDLITIIKGPDFPSKMLLNSNDLYKLYTEGKNSITMSSTFNISKDDNSILIESLPYLTSKTMLIDELIISKKIEGIEDIMNESTSNEICIKIKFKKGIDLNIALNQIKSLNSVCNRVSFNFLFYEENANYIKDYKLDEIIDTFLSFRKQVLYRKFFFQVNKIKNKLKNLFVIYMLIENNSIEYIISLVLKSKNDDEMFSILKRINILISKTIQENEYLKTCLDLFNIKDKFIMDDNDIKLLLQTKISSLSKKERNKVFEDIKANIESINKLNYLLSNPINISNYIKDELIDINTKFIHERKVKLISMNKTKIDNIIAVQNKDVKVFVFSEGILCLENTGKLKVQNKGGKGSNLLGKENVKGELIKVYDFNINDRVIIFYENGNAITTELVNIFEKFTKTDSVVCGILNSKFSINENIIFITKNGKIRNSHYSIFESFKAKNPKLVIKLVKNDKLNSVITCNESSKFNLISKNGMCLTINPSQIKQTGKRTFGVIGMKVKKEDNIISCKNVKPLHISGLFIITDKGIGRIINSKECFDIRNRATIGIKCLKNNKVGNVVSTGIIYESSKLISIISKTGKIITLEVNKVPKLSRYSTGFKLIKLDSDDAISDIVVI